MYRAMLVPLDGSPLAERALPYARRVAQAGDGRLILLSVVPAARIPDTGAFHEHMEARHKAAAYLDTVAAHLAAGGDRRTVETYVRDGEPAAVIAAQAAEQQADLLVMGTHGHSGLGRWLYGSVADHVLRHAGVPVFLVPALTAHPWPVDRPPRILVALDGSDPSQEILNPASDLAGTLGADLVLVQVVEVPTYRIGPFGEAYAYTSYHPSADIASATQYLEGIAALLRGRGHSVAVEAPFGFPAQEIAALARERQADVIAMATHGRTGLARIVMGSVAAGTLQRAGVPMLLVRPGALHGAAAPQSEEPADSSR